MCDFCRNGGFAKNESGEPRVGFTAFIFVFTFVISLPPVETQVPYCTEFLRNF